MSSYAVPKMGMVESLCRMTEYATASKTLEFFLSKRQVTLKALLIEYANGFWGKSVHYSHDMQNFIVWNAYRLSVGRKIIFFFSGN